MLGLRASGLGFKSWEFELDLQMWVGSRGLRCVRTFYRIVTVAGEPKHLPLTPEDEVASTTRTSCARRGDSLEQASWASGFKASDCLRSELAVEVFC